MSLISYTTLAVLLCATSAHAQTCPLPNLQRVIAADRASCAPTGGGGTLGPIGVGGGSPVTYSFDADRVTVAWSCADAKGGPTLTSSIAANLAYFQRPETSKVMLASMATLSPAQQAALPIWCPWAEGMAAGIIELSPIIPYVEPDRPKWTGGSPAAAK